MKARPAKSSPARAGLAAWCVLAVLLIVPVIALLQVPIGGWWMAAGFGIISALTYMVYAGDKRRAQANAWRIPEAHLHLLELLGGWPAAWMAQRRLRHKCSKVSYQCTFWLIVGVHEFAAYDFLQDWRWSGALIRQWL